MATKLKSMFKRQMSEPSLRKIVENPEELDATKTEMKNVPVEVLHRKRSEKVSSPSPDATDNGKNGVPVVLRRKKARRHVTSLGVIEDLLQCPVCKARIKSPRMMPCQHTFCQSCLEKQFDTSNKNTGYPALVCPLCRLEVTDRSPNLLPTNLHIENLLRILEKSGEGWLSLGSKNPVVSFAPLPQRVCKSEIYSNDPQPLTLAILCNKCSAPCGKQNKCKHCQQFFCTTCWTCHVDDLKKKLERILPQMELTSGRLEERIEEFRAKAENLKIMIEEEVEVKMAALMEECKQKIKKLSLQCDRGEASADKIRERIVKFSSDTKSQIDGLYDTLTDNNDKVKLYIALNREATELMKLESSWNPELGEQRVLVKSKIDHSIYSKSEVDSLYSRSFSSSKFVINRDITHPSRMALDPLRNHVYVACPGVRQIVIFDKKYELYKKYQSKEMMAPQGLAYAEDTEELFVTDKWKHCIFVFNRKGEIVRRMCSEGSGKSQLSSPEGLAFHKSKNLIYVADTGNDRVQILECDGTHHSFIGHNERVGNGVTKSGKIASVVVNHLNQPTDVAVTDDCVIVADCGNHKVKIFNHDGNLVHALGGSGTFKRQFKSPEVVDVDIRGNIIVGDSGNARLQIFSPRGDLIKILSGRTVKSKKISWISGLLVKTNYDILVADNKSNVIKVY